MTPLSKSQYILSVLMEYLKIYFYNFIFKQRPLLSYIINDLFISIFYGFFFSEKGLRPNTNIKANAYRVLHTNILY